MIHLALHLLVPVALALAAYRSEWRMAAAIMLATMAVDVDHLLADPIYDPTRCSIGFHPLHRTLPIVGYTLLAAVPGLMGPADGRPGRVRRVVHLVGAGLLVHMALDGLDCMR